MVIFFAEVMLSRGYEEVKPISRVGNRFFSTS
jgi:hypothetical protein